MKRKERENTMNNNLEIAVINGKATRKASQLYKKHHEEGIPYVELRKGKRYGTIWFETPGDISFDPQSVFELREWYESYWLKRRHYKGLHPYQFSLGPSAIWFKFVLEDFSTVRDRLSKLRWPNPQSHKRLKQIHSTSEKIFWHYTDCYFKKSMLMLRKRGQKADMSDWIAPVS